MHVQLTTQFLDMSWFVAVAKNSFEHFANNTTLHGFKELHHSKSLIWKTIWLLVVVVTMLLSFYQMYFLVLSINEQPTVTVIESLSINDDVEYPELKFCYNRLISVIDWHKVANMSFSKPAILYGLSHFHETFSETLFDAEEAKKSFDETMKLNKLNTLKDFMSAVTFAYPPRISRNDDGKSVFKKIGDPIISKLCFVLTSEDIKADLQSNAETIHVSDSSELVFYYASADVDLDPRYVTLEEYSYFLKNFFQSYYDLDKHNHSITDIDNPLKLQFDPLINVDGSESLMKPSKEVINYYFKISASKYQWLPEGRQPCSSHNTSFHSYCRILCKCNEFRRIYPQKCIRTRAAILINDFDNVCSYGIQYKNLSAIYPSNINEFRVKLNPTDEYNKCLSKNCGRPCVQWKFTSSMSMVMTPTELVSINMPSLIQIEYPKNSDVQTISEIEARTWESIVGGLGGIIGLWLGASITSVLQMVYLCCCVACDERLSDSKTAPKKHIYRVGVQQVDTSTRRKSCF